MRFAAFLFFIFLCPALRAQIVSNFTSNNEGWTVFSTVTATSTPATYSASGGNPANSGEITFAAGMTMTGVGYYWSAPAKFLGDLSAAYNQNFTFDMHTSYPGNDNTLGDIIISNSTVAGATLYYQLPGKPPYMLYFGGNYTIQLVESFAGWHYGSMTGPTPSSAQMKQVLGNITGFQIRLKYYAGNSTFTVTGFLDNVMLYLAPPTITQQPTITCKGTTVVLSVAATGNSNISYQWQKFNAFNQWSDITNDATFSGASSASLNIIAGPSSTGTYRAVVNGSGAPLVFSNSIDITATTCNAAPVIEATAVEAVIQGRVMFNLSSKISDPDNNLDLNTLVITKQPSSGAKASIDAQRNLVLDYKTTFFSGRETLTIRVCDKLGACTETPIVIDVLGDIIVHNGMSPNNDNKNDTFEIQFIDALDNTRKNHVSLYNRWGDLIFEVDDYDNATHVFKGLNSSGSEIPSGTYFYKIEFTSERKPLTGYLQVKR